MDFFKSKQTLHRYPTDFLIGDLLVKAGVIPQAKLDEAIKLSGAKHLQLGQMLIMSGAINSHQLQCAVDAQSLVRDRTIDLNEALKVLKQACKSGQSLAEVISEGHSKQSSGPTNKLGEVLLEAGLINSDQFSKAMQRSQATGLPLGRILVLNNTLADAVLNLALDLQVRVRDEMLSRTEAIIALRNAAGIEDDEMPDPNRIAQAQAALKAPRKHGVRIGEMFVRAGLLTETDVMNALETGLATEQLIGQVLVGQGFITEQILEAALGLQKLVDGHHLDVDKAIDTLSMIQSSGITYDEAVESLHIDETPQSETISFDHMLVLARVLTETEIAEAVQKAMEDPKIVGQILLMTGHLDKNTLKAALRAHFLLAKGTISQDDAVVGLDYTMHSSSKLSFDGALQELGWDISNLPRDEVDPEIRAMEEARKDFGVSSDDELTKFVDKAKEVSSAAATTDAAPVDIDEEVKAVYEPLAPDEIQIQSGTYDKVEAPAQESEAAGDDEEESWDVPGEEAEPAKEEEKETKRSLSGLLSHEDLEPVETKKEEEKTVAPKAGGKFANLLGGDEPAVKKSSETEEKEKAAAKEKAEAEKAKAEKEAAEKAEVEKAKADKAAADRAAAEALAEEIRAAEKVAAEKRAAEQAAAEKAAAEKAAAEKAAAEKAAAEKAAAEKAAAEKAAAEKAAAEKAAAEKAAAEKAAVEKAAAEKAAAERAAAEKAAAEKAAAERAAAEKAAAEKAAAAKAAAAPATPPADGAPVKKVGSFQSLLSDEPVKKPDAPAAAPAAAKAPAPASAPSVTPAAPAAPAATTAAPPATPNVAAALSALTRAHPPASGAHQAQTAPAAAAAGAPPAAPKPATAPGAQPAAAATGQPTVRPSIPAPVSAPGVAKPAPVQAPGAARPAVQPVAGGPNGGGQGAAPPRVATPAAAAPAVAAPAAPAAQATATRTEDDVKDALSGAYARLAESYYEQGSYGEALNLYEKILAVREQELGEGDAELVSDLANVVRVLCVQNKFDNAESYVRRIIGILEMTQPDDAQKLADALNTLAQIYFQQNKFDQCLPVLERSVKLKQQVLGEDHVDMVDCYKDLARLMRKLNRTEEAEHHYSKAKAISGKGAKPAVV